MEGVAATTNAECVKAKVDGVRQAFQPGLSVKAKQVSLERLTCWYPDTYSPIGLFGSEITNQHRIGF